MVRYELYLFLHVVGAIVWLGAGLTLSVLAYRATRARDNQSLQKLAAESTALSTTVFMPAALTVLAMGILMVVDGPWEFSQLWIVLGLSGYALTLATGLLFAKPKTEKIDAMIGKAGGMTPDAARETQRLLVIGRADLVVLYLIVADMVLKPSGGDVGVLAGMAAVLAAALAYAIIRLHQLDEATRVTPVSGSPAGA